MQVPDEDLHNYIVIIWETSTRVHRLLECIHITLEGVIRKAKKFNKPYTIFVDYEYAISYIKDFYMKQDLIEALKEIIETDYKLSTENLTRESSLNDLGLDSLESLNLLYSIEGQYNIKFDDKFVPETVGELIDEIEKLRK